MTNSSKVVGWLLIAFGLIANPYFLEKLFSNDGIITSVGFIITALLAEFIFVLFGVTLIKKHSNHHLINIGLMLISFIFIMSTTVVVDRVYGRFFYLIPITYFFQRSVLRGTQQVSST